MGLLSNICFSTGIQAKTTKCKTEREGCTLC